MTQPVHVPTSGPPPTPVIGGRYRVLHELGRGGMATVHRAFDEVLDREVALKLLHPHLTSDRRVLDRFRREARAAASLQHAGVVAVHDWGIDDDTPYLVMELVEGRSLRSVLDVRGRLRPGEALALLTPAIGGLGAAHAAGIVHRDVTPSNLLLTGSGASKIGDFGLARSVAATSATFGDAVIGSPHYLSPEAARGERLDARADVYGLGCVLYECLTGRPPLDGDSAIAIASRHATDPVPLPSVLTPGLPMALDRVVAVATAMDPDDRFPDAAAFGAAFAAAVPDGPEAVDLRDGSTTTVILPEHATRVIDDMPAVDEPRRPRPWRRWLLGLLVVALLAGGGWVAFDQVVAPVTAIPDVTGLPSVDARRELEDLGFRVAVDDEQVFDRDVPEGSVVSQSHTQPARTTTTIRLVLSSGPRMDTLPALVGRTATDARAALEALGLDLEIATETGYDDDAPAGTVLSALPAGGALVAEGTLVTLTISDGPAPVEVPAVVGTLEGAATAELLGLGLDVRVVGRRYDSSPVGSVVESTPPAGATLRRGDEVTLVVSDGPEPVEVPNVVRKREADAIRTLEALGFVVDVRYVKTLLPFAQGIVDAQDPDPGSVRPKGDTVRIFVWD